MKMQPLPGRSDSSPHAKSASFLNECTHVVINDPYSTTWNEQHLIKCDGALSGIHFILRGDECVSHDG